MEDDLMAKATLYNMKDNIIPLFKEHEIAKEIMDALEEKYGPRSDTHIQLFLNKYNSTRINEDDFVGNFVNQMVLIVSHLITPRLYLKEGKSENFQFPLSTTIFSSISSKIINLAAE
jgi:hypothetical protein